MTSAVMTGRLMKISVMLIRFYDTALSLLYRADCYQDTVNAGQENRRFHACCPVNAKARPRLRPDLDV
jgi:hypothetical protein